VTDSSSARTHGIVQTVSGPVSATELGAVLMHEHLVLVDPEFIINRPDMWDENDAVRRSVAAVQAAGRSGINTIVDLTAWGLGRDVARTRQINDSVDLHLVVATGFYTWHDLPLWAKRLGARPAKVDILTEIFVDELHNGIAGTGIRPAVLKCATERYGLTFDVERVLRAVSAAHIETGAPIFTHAHAKSRRGLDQLRVFAEEGVALDRVVIGHCGDSTDQDYLKEIADTGATLGMDRFGMAMGAPFDQRVKTIVSLCDAGYSDRIVLSSDYGVHSRIEDDFAAEYQPNHSHAFVVDTVVPALLVAGMQPRHVDQLLRRTPQRILAGIQASDDVS
jgi:phosphotriesterase-related protein